MKSILFLCVGLLFSGSIFSQPDAYTEAAIQCLKSNGTTAYYETIFETCFKQMQEQYAKFNIPPATWTKLKAVKPEAMKMVNSQLVSAYSDFFTLEDVLNMKALYSSPAGQTMIKNPNALTKKDKKQIDSFYKSSTGKKIVSSESGMNKKMQDISNFWCSDMYKTVNDKLEAQGFPIR